MRHRRRFRRGRPKSKVIVEFNFEIKKLNPVPIKDENPIYITKEELEAMRLVDFENKTQEEAALIMRVSRVKVSRLLNSARKKIIEAIIYCKPVIIVENSEVI